MHYYEYWGLHKSPFDNVPDPSMYVSCHASAENAIAETLFAIEEGNDCISVIVGDVGLGKTMSLRMVIDSLKQEKYKIAFVVNPDISFIQLLKEIMGQLTGVQCEVKKKVDLLEAFNKLLFETMDQGKKVVIFIDEANAMPPANLEKLRLLTNLQPDETNLFTMVLAGQMEFAKRLAHPKRANLFQRIGTYCTLEKIESKELVKSYVEARLALSGASKKIFTDEAIDALWEYSGPGVPRLINKVCKLCLKAGETNGFDRISGEVVRQIGERFQRLSMPATAKTKKRDRSEGYEAEEEPLRLQEESDPREEATPEPRLSSGERHESFSSGPQVTEAFSSNAQVVESLPSGPQVPEEAPSSGRAAEEQAAHEEPHSIGHAAPPPLAQKQPAEPPPSRGPETEEPPSAPDDGNVLAFGARSRPDGSAEEPGAPAATGEAASSGRAPDQEQILIVQHGINVALPFDVITQFRTSTEENGVKLAGVLAAQAMQRHPQLTAKWGADPLAVWSDIREAILDRLKREQAAKAP